jgi:hypothetical protein
LLVWWVVLGGFFSWVFLGFFLPALLGFDLARPVAQLQRKVRVPRALLEPDLLRLDEEERDDLVVRLKLLNVSCFHGVALAGLEAAGRLASPRPLEIFAHPAGAVGVGLLLVAAAGQRD